MDGHSKTRRRVVVIGGGTGTYTTLLGLRNYPNLDLSAIVTMADDGGSNKILRDDFGMLPTSGVRQCMVALSQNEGLLKELFAYRYYRGVGISGMTFGNLFMAAATDILGDEKAAIAATCKLLGVRGKILPVSYEKVTMLATYEDGTEIIGEHLIDLAGSKTLDMRITDLRLIPKVTIDKEAREAILNADLIVIGPGDLYGNTIVNLVVTGMSEALLETKGKILFVCNLMNKRGESPGYKASDYLRDLGKYMPISRLDYVLINTDHEAEKDIVAKYKEEGASWVVDDLSFDNNWPKDLKIIRDKLVAKDPILSTKGDALPRSMIRHDYDKLARVISQLM